MKPKHTYKDFVTGKTRYTRGKFAGWTPGMGLIGVTYAIFCTHRTQVLIPKYLLTKETLAAIEGRQLL